MHKRQVKVWVQFPLKLGMETTISGQKDFSKLPPKDPGFYFPQNKCDICFMAGKEYKYRVTPHLMFEQTLL